MLVLVSGCFSELQPTSRPDSEMLQQCCDLSSDLVVATSFDRKGLATERQKKRERQEIITIWRLSEAWPSWLSLDDVCFAASEVKRKDD